METVWFASHSPTRAASASTAWAISAEEQTGLVLGIRFTKVYPPAAAAAEPVEISSLYSKPGVRQWQWVSMKAGSTVRPLASSTVSLPGQAAPGRQRRSCRRNSQTSTGLLIAVLCVADQHGGNLLTIPFAQRPLGYLEKNFSQKGKVKKSHSN